LAIQGEPIPKGQIYVLILVPILAPLKKIIDCPVHILVVFEDIIAVCDFPKNEVVNKIKNDNRIFILIVLVS